MNEQSSHGLTWVAGVAWTAAVVFAAAPGCSQGAGSQEGSDLSSENVTGEAANGGGHGGSSGGHSSSGGSSSGGSTTSLGTDPGPRAGAAGAGGALATLDGDETAFFTAARAVFAEVDSVSGTLSGEIGAGLGPTFNGNACSMCHAQPAMGGSSPGMSSPQNPVPNPQLALATLDGAANTVPSFITSAGPVREARFKSDGGVHGLFTIQGRNDASGCTLAQPDFATALSNNNVIFRIPTPTFGLGLVEATPDAALQANLTANRTSGAKLGIGGVLNTIGNDGTVTRFGWKAQNKSLTIFAGEAYNVEQGVTNAAFPDEREGGAGSLTGCMAFNPTPEDNVNPAATGTVSDVHSDVMNFEFAMELSAPPATAVPSGSTQAAVTQGQKVFISVGCANCHTQAFTTAASSFDPAMSSVTIHPYSDFGLHTMGSLADGITQGNAAGNTFRTAPLWGLGQRMFFLHDGRTSDLVVAIQDHQSSGSGASVTVSNLANQSGSDQQAVLDFLRSL
jgi:CxxC motif-containing protein (DUF1111 family)